MGELNAGRRGADAAGRGGGMTPSEIAQRRLAALPRSDASDDLLWAMNCRAWAERDPPELLLEFARLAKAGERVPEPLMHWVTDAIEASMVKPDNRGSELLIELGLKVREGRPPARLPPPRMLALERRPIGRKPPTIRALAAKYSVSSAAIHAHLKKTKAAPAEVAALLQGLTLARSFLRLKRR